MLRLSDRTVDLTRGVVRVGDDELRLTTKETELLVYLADRPGVVVPRDTLLGEVWGYQPTAVTRAVDNMIRKLRVKIEPDPLRSGPPAHGVRRGVPVRPGAVARAGRAHRPTSDTALRPRDRSGRAGRADRGLARRRPTVPVPGGTRRDREVHRRAAGRPEQRPGGWGVVVPARRRRRGARARAAGERRDGATERGLERALSSSACLLVLDGCDTLDAEAEDAVGSWIARFPSLDVVATTRVRRFGRFSTVVEVPPLDVEAARTMLDACVARVRPDQPLLASEATALLERLDGWPVAIELAAARIRFLSGPEVVRRLDVSLLEVLRDPSGPSSRSLEAALRETIRALEPSGSAGPRALCGVRR